MKEKVLRNGIEKPIDRTFVLMYHNYNAMRT